MAKLMLNEENDDCSISFGVCRKLPRVLHNSLLCVHSRYPQLPGAAWFAFCSLSSDLKHPVQRFRVDDIGILLGKDLDGESTVLRCQRTSDVYACDC